MRDHGNLGALDSYPNPGEHLRTYVLQVSQALAMVMTDEERRVALDRLT
jgi:hypothetical protein